MTLRKLHKSDLTQLLILEEIGQVIPWTEDAFIHCIASGYLGWVLEQEGEIIGFVLISVRAGESHILNLCVDPKHQHKGYGLQLMQRALEEAVTLSAAIAYLEVRRTNARAIRLYKKMGFVQIGERKDYYPDSTGREDALVFAKDLIVK